MNYREIIPRVNNTELNRSKAKPYILAANTEDMYKVLMEKYNLTLKQVRCIVELKYKLIVETLENLTDEEIVDIDRKKIVINLPFIGTFKFIAHALLKLQNRIQNGEWSSDREKKDIINEVLGRKVRQNTSTS